MPRVSLAFVLALVGCDPALLQPAPDLISLSPELLCHAESTTTVTVRGVGFTPAITDAIAGPARLDKPELRLTLTSNPVGGPASDERILGTDESLQWHSSSELRFDVGPDASLQDGLYSLTLTNLDGQDAAIEGALLAVGPPVLTSATPTLFCGEQRPVEFVLTGQNFLQIGDETPTVTIGSWSGPAEVGACESLVGPVQGERCDELRVELEPDTLTAGVHDIVVVNPAPADCTSPTLLQVEVVVAPVIEEVRPDQVCVEGSPSYTLVDGSGFLFADGEPPLVWVDDDPYLPEERGGCVELAGPTPGEVCSELYLTIDPTTYELGDVLIDVVNPEPAACETDLPGVLTITPPPEIDYVEPDRICDVGGIFVIHGSGFVRDAEVLLGGEPATDVVWLDDSSYQVTVEGPLTPGLLDLEIRNPDGCETAAEAIVEVVRTPILFYVDPPVSHSDISIDATLFISGISGEVTDVWLIEDDSGDRIDVDFSWEGGSTVIATLPVGLTAGDYSVFAQQDSACPFGLPGAVSVTDDLDIALDRIDPAFAWTDAPTPTQLFTLDPLPDGKVGFEDVPRVYLNPVDGGTATALRSVSMRDERVLDATIPTGMDAGLYDIFVVNPSGAVGLIDEGLRVTEEPPPLVESVAPATVTYPDDETVTINGANFRDPEVVMTCLSLDTGTLDTPRAVTIVSSDADSLRATLPTSRYSSAQVCTITVTNDDDTSFEFSAVTITNPSRNFYPWRAGPELETGRRAPAAASGRANALARYIYAVGGDTGSVGGALDSIEVVRIGRFGDLGTWRTTDATLPAARTLAGVASIGRFIFVVGGHDGAGPVDTVWRAQVLDPLQAPVYDDLSVAFGDGDGLEGGTWIYRIAALFPDDDDSNPGGESLASDPIVLRLPDVDERMHVDLAWTDVDGASGYRVYRSPTADAGSRAEVWLTDVESTSVLDDGLTTESEVEPLPLGSLGRWATLPSLPAPVYSPCVTAAPDPSDPDVTHLYVAGGSLGASATPAIRHLDVETVDEHTQAVGSWALDSSLLSSGRYECGAWTVDDTFHSKPGADEAWVYFGGGRTATGTTGTTEAGRVLAGGALGSWTTVSRMTPTRAGFGLLSSGNLLYAFGGQNGSPAAGSVSADITTLPSLGGWSNMGVSMSEARYLMGSAQESAVIVVVGGQTGTSAASRTVDFTNF